MPPALKQPDPSSALPVFLVEKWHKVHIGLHLIILSSLCSLLAMLPLTAIYVVLAFGINNNLRYHYHAPENAFPAAHDLDQLLTRVGFAASAAMMGVCVLFGVLGHVMCCEAPLSSGAKFWFIFSLVLSLSVVLPGAASWFAGITRFEPANAWKFLQTDTPLRYGFDFEVRVWFLAWNLFATLANVFFVIGLLNIHRIFAKRKARMFPAACSALLVWFRWGSTPCCCWFSVSGKRCGGNIGTPQLRTV